MAVKIKDATVFLGGCEILHHISWQVARGERCFILGANGAGKTTMVKLIMGYSWPLYGAEVQILGHTFGKVNLAELRKSIAWVSPFMQQWMNGEWTGIEMVISGFDGTLGLFREATAAETAQAEEALRQLRSMHLRDRSFHTMSSGEQVKVLIARALITRPELMILDEPSVYLDIAGREFLLHTIDELARTRPELTIIFITQRIEDILPVFDRGMILKSGSILAGGGRDDVLTEENLRRAYDIDIRLIRTGTGRLWTVIE